MVRIKRIYDSPARSRDDGKRILVDRLWPRGLKKDEVDVDEWIKEIAPSSELRKWFSHDPSKWPEFKRRYWQELEKKKEIVRPFADGAGKGNLTILYAAKDEEHNNAVVLKEFIDRLAAR